MSFWEDFGRFSVQWITPVALGLYLSYRLWFKKKKPKFKFTKTIKTTGNFSS